MAIRVGINGFGRIGKNLARLMINDPDVELVAFNARQSAKVYAYTFKYDTIHGNWKGEVRAEDDGIVIDGKKVKMTKAGAGEWQWGALGCDVVIEATGKFKDKAACEGHLKCGAKKVIISAPAKDVDGTFVYNVNHASYDPARHTVISNASCTTNCLAPVAKVLHEKFGILKGIMTTIHSYTTSQAILDSAVEKDLRRGRAAGLNLVPTTTGAAKAVGLVLPELAGKLDGLSIRCPTADGSMVDLVCMTGRATTKEEVNAAFKAAANETLGYSEEPIVSSDIIGSTFGAVVDAPLTNVMDGNLVKVMAWYDNEQSFNNQLLRMVKHVGNSL